MINLLVPTRGRPDKCRRMIDSVKKTSNGNVNILLAILEHELPLYQDMEEDAVIKIVPEWTTVMSWNYLAMLVRGSLFMLGSDDIIFSTQGWDIALLEHYAEKRNKIHVYSLLDSRDQNGTPHPIITKEYIDAMGYFLPPLFMHWYIDTWTVEIAKANNCFTHLTEYLLVHDKPSDKGNPDETHNRIRRNGWLERDSYTNTKCRHFLEVEKKRLAEAICQ